MRLPDSTGAAIRTVEVRCSSERIIDRQQMDGSTTHCDLKIRPGCVVEVFDDGRSIGVYTPENGWE